MKLKDVIERFSGAPGEDVEQWLDKAFVGIKLLHDTKEDAEGVTLAKQILARSMPLILSGAAYRTWKLLSAKEKDDFDAIAKALRRVYGKTKATAWAELKALRLLPGEPVDVLADEVGTLLGIVTGGKELPSQMAAAFVLDALPARVAEQVRLQHGEEMELTNVVSAAKAILAGLRPPEGAAAGVTQERPAAGGRRPPFGERNGGASRTVRCFGCDRAGHVRRDCNVVCFRCREKGHIGRYCPESSTVERQGNGPAEAASPDRAAPAKEL